jgi:phage tail sheath protein FI
VYRWVPLNGDMAGLWARVTPWESAAGYNKGIIKNVIKLAFNPNKEQRDVLYGKDINPVMTKAGQGTLLFGDKTGLGTYTGSAFTRLNVRRLFIVVEKAIATTSQQFLFEFNDDFTQSQFKNLVEPLLRDIQGRRGIIDFRVVSDSRVNTPDVIDRNIFRGNIYIKPARSINFIELTFVATRTGVEFDEIIGQTV